MADPHYTIRPALPHEAAALTDLLRRSKRYWGYDDAFMEAARPQLVITAASIEQDQVEALILDGQVRGFFRLCHRENNPHKLWLEDLFLDPAVIGQGWGRIMWNRVIEAAASLDYRVLEWETDPHAEPFYQRMGAVTVGQSESSIFPGRLLPVMRCEVARPFTNLSG